MRNSRTIEELPSISLQELGAAIKRKGLSLGELDSDKYKDTGVILTSRYSWRVSDRWGNPTGSYSANLELRRDGSGLLFDFYTQDRKKIGDTYRLIRKKSNLIEGSYRYYIEDCFFPGRFCSKLYYIPEVGEFVPRSILKSHNIIYRLQKRSKIERTYLSPVKIPPTRYRKRHYRGKPTPFWARVEALRDREEIRLLEFYAGNGLSIGILPPEIEKNLIESYNRHTGRTSLPPRLYPRSRRPR